ncbi:bifunctional diaminohydroxyphosphoribosylaminopyrimidine deaminase/5-amino-6-(5-phosphoribosylamino)uracil reductase RibD [Synechocystis salina]|uniref:Riboflavin biosynthesis protein RibD n=1 Tax=Synechocystis salina LEGE 00031 TaxID=1828736 RepID=A0ABR9VTS9_9SYNC|nr:bifunctional diaminohydroxyphosphoribosylaminopyrimidine deaminase/5-amino-6-(5-phosphoribosylamino)uracil reductase RibD [Synechocystis salina]MBE9240987.1 bifunctional diaminohydroxyphosphoribosylaminopyrimidine deaminase/5-amino-6-(5-phosphoribosylamino)uracil reductase RibD [Synechocystis salina LEGE 00041]MBE9254456.1 bifunctional diaminohydroxyphosphoribosylaminopyrimidine deaminase/5-amino-6-(5-phosphoribosylamino)uracil reductase RibD [Synechocystis salina LEGE 00031]
MISDQTHMRRCLTLAKTAIGKTAPNPLVGSVIVQGDQIVGQGFHPQAGQSHAEIFALWEAGDRAKGATLYVNLEPCNHQGRTPPCTEAIIKAGISKVVVGMVDPNPLVAGKGISRLRQAGIEVKVGVEEKACQRLNEAFCFRIQHRRPFGIFKYAMTLDGKIATAQGHSSWVTSRAARHWVHQLRSQCQAVIIGGNTVRRDNPLLTTHGLSDQNPWRVVLSRTLDLPLEAQLWHQEIAKTLVVTTKNCDHNMLSHLEKLGIETLILDPLTPLAVMTELYQRDCLQVLWECGGILAAEAIAMGTVQKVHAFLAPKIIGGGMAPTPVGELGFQRMTEALNLTNLHCQAIGPDWLFTGYLAANADDGNGQSNI